MELGYFLIGLPFAFGLGYIVGLIKSDKQISKEHKRSIKIISDNKDDKQCVGYRGGNKCTRRASYISLNGLCNSCDDARFGY